MNVPSLTPIRCWTAGAHDQPRARAEFAFCFTQDLDVVVPLLGALDAPSVIPTGATTSLLFDGPQPFAIQTAHVCRDAQESRA